MTGAPTAEALQRLAATPVLLIALDFDGTLAPIVDVPADARALPEARDAVLALLDLPATHVAYVSGRAMESLAAVSDLPDHALLAGSHGVEVRTEGRVTLDLSDAEQAERDRLEPLLAGIAGPLDGVWIEEKPAGFAMHTRLADADATAAAEEQALAAADAEERGITVRRGQDVLEFSVRGTTKGDAIDRLREQTGATAVLFAGDDVTDEDGFGALGGDDLGVKVGPGETRAGCRVAGPAEMAAVLAELGQLRRGRV
ncbi:trehalose-phosphatase [Herbiconiux flava]|uniref:Trehalose 6-phosphate phosphatase n=1 Tax=Herbiconiux flava TaxID=881268 RepID=A0A852STG6_9MICO|nr:trehalose-phosphatase [Herbiconiux flava]NYD72276.1 trehalose 6-phosphate phosphatase [Herbiconiux flava]GLK17761.1 trehalose 6-phosphate phosphatase [Herbiconiux flava]